MPTPTGFTKITYFFSGGGGIGWTETWYSAVSSPSGVVAAGQAIAKERVKFLDVPFNLDYMRIASIPPVTVPATLPSPSILSALNLSGQWPGRTAPNLSYMPSWAALYKVTSTDGHKRQLSFRGIYMGAALKNSWFAPESIPGVLPQPGGNFETALATNGFVLLINGTPNLKPITAAAPDPMNNGLVLCKSAAHGLATGQYITLYRMKSVPSLAGKKKVIVKDPDNFYLAGTNLQTLTYTGLGQFRLFTPALSGALKMTPTRLAERRTGRPFALLHGKSKHHL